MIVIITIIIIIMIITIKVLLSCPTVDLDITDNLGRGLSEMVSGDIFYIFKQILIQQSNQLASLPTHLESSPPWQ